MAAGVTLPHRDRDTVVPLPRDARCEGSSPPGKAPANAAPGPERSGHRVRTAPLCFASRGFSLHAATRIAGPGPGRARTFMPLRGPAGPGGRASAHSRCRAPFLRAQNALVGWDQPSGTVPPGTAGETGSSGTPAPVPSSPLPRCPGAPCPGLRPHRARQAGYGTASSVEGRANDPPGAAGPWRCPQRLD